jgi:hypothetical protein
MKQDLQVKNRVKEILKMVQMVAPGNSVELRIPPHAAIQCVSGIVHRRGTPHNVVEMSGHTLIKSVEDPANREKFCYEGLISASGINSNLAHLFVGVGKIMDSEVWSKNGK